MYKENGLGEETYTIGPYVLPDDRSVKSLNEESVRSFLVLFVFVW